MADKEAIFKNLKNAATGVAEAADLASEGDDSTDNEGIGTLAFQDSVGDMVRPDLQPEDGDSSGEGLPVFAYLNDAGNLTRPTLTPSGAIAVDPTGGGTCKQADGSLVEQGDQDYTDITGAVVTLDGSRVLERIEFRFSSGGPAV